MGARESLTALAKVFGSAAFDETDLILTESLDSIDPAREIHQRYWEWLLRRGRKAPSRKGSEGSDPQSGIPRQRWAPLIPPQIPQFDEREFIEAQRNIRRIARQLRTKISRTWRRTKKRENLDFRTTLRRSISTGGVFIDLKWNTRAIKKPRIVAILDTSGSMDPFVRLLIQLVQAIRSEISDLELFIFSNQLEHVTGSIRSDWQSTVHMLEKTGNWGGGTRLQESLRRLLDRHTGVLTGRTVVILLSDLKTHRLDLCADSFNDIGRRVRRIYLFRTVGKGQRDYAEIDPEFRQNIDFLKRSVDRIFTIANLPDMVKAVRGLVLR